MALNLEQKKAVVAEVAVIAAEAQSAVAAEYRGLTVEEMTNLRATARQGGVYLLDRQAPAFRLITQHWSCKELIRPHVLRPI